MTENNPATTVNVVARNRALNTAIADGKITRSRKAHYANLWDADPAGTQRLLDSMFAVGFEVGPSAQRRSPRAAVRPRQVEQRRSQWASGVTVDVDAYALNPLVDDARQAVPDTYRLAASEAVAPQLFATGDLPVFIASGADPQLLQQLPWQARHPAAALDAQQFAGFLEQYAGNDVDASMDFGGHPGNAAYRSRVSAWLSGRGTDRGRWSVTPSAQQQRLRDAAADETYRSLYGAQDAAKAQQQADAAEDRQAQAAFDQQRQQRLAARRERGTL